MVCLLNDIGVSFDRENPMAEDLDQGRLVFDAACKGFKSFTRENF